MRKKVKLSDLDSFVIDLDLINKYKEKNRLTIGLIGDLGAGKTTLSQAILKNLGVKVLITSPTYTIVNSYEVPGLKINHFDLYRLNNEEELYELGFLEYLQNNINIIEWADKFLFPIDLKITLEGYKSDRTIHWEWCQGE